MRPYAPRGVNRTKLNSTKKHTQREREEQEQEQEKEEKTEVHGRKKPIRSQPGKRLSPPRPRYEPITLNYHYGDMLFTHWSTHRRNSSRVPAVGVGWDGERTWIDMAADGAHHSHLFWAIVSRFLHLFLWPLQRPPPCKMSCQVTWSSQISLLLQVDVPGVQRVCQPCFVQSHWFSVLFMR